MAELFAVAPFPVAAVGRAGVEDLFRTAGVATEPGLLGERDALHIIVELCLLLLNALLISQLAVGIGQAQVIRGLVLGVVPGSVDLDERPGPARGPSDDQRDDQR